jgi:hypothetical protein
MRCRIDGLLLDWNIRLAQWIQYGRDGEKAVEMSLIVRVFDSNAISGKEIPPSLRGSDEVVVEMSVLPDE